MSKKIFLFLIPSLIFSVTAISFAQKKVKKKTDEVVIPAPQQKQESKIKELGKKFFDKDTIHTIRISFTQCNYWDSLKIYKKRSDSLHINNYMMVNISVDGKMHYVCGVRFKGESSYDFYPGVKKSFRIKFDKFRKKQDLYGLHDLNLTNNFKDPTMLRDKIYLDILRKHGLPAPRSTFAKVYINNKYWGLYLANENIDEIFLQSQFGEKQGNLYQGEPISNFVDYGNHQSEYYNKYSLKTNTDKNDWGDLVAFIKLINDTTGTEKDYVDRLERAFDLNSCLKAWAINNLIGNVDAYNMFFPHNYFVYHDSTFRWHWISLDGNYSFAAWNPTMNYSQLLRMSVMVPDSVPYKDERPLLSHTIARNKIIQKRYLSYVSELFLDDFSPEHINNLIDSMSSKIRIAVYADTHKMFSNTDYDTNLKSTLGDPTDPGNFIPGLKQYMSDRRNYIIRELDVMLSKLK